LWAQVIRHARCADSSLHPDAWFPVSVEPAKARLEAAAAITVCASCPVRDQCLALSLRHWDIGQHGTWGGLIAADRARMRRARSADHSRRRKTAVVRGEGAAVLSLVLSRVVHGGGGSRPATTRAR
jgi:hypothetical protein